MFVNVAPFCCSKLVFGAVHCVLGLVGVMRFSVFVMNFVLCLGCPSLKLSHGFFSVLTFPLPLFRSDVFLIMLGE